jgi:hypothetical protein
MRFIKKAVIFITSIMLLVVVYLIFSTIFAYTKGYVFESRLIIYISNIFNNTKFENEYFTIELSKFDWQCIYSTDDAQVLSFRGLSMVNDDGNVFAPTVSFLKFGVPPDYPSLEKLWFENDISSFEQVCSKHNATLVKTSHIIDNKEFVAYDCLEEQIIRYIMYKDAFFLIVSYDNDKLRAQYDKFFQGVKLKQ